MSRTLRTAVLLTVLVLAALGVAAGVASIPNPGAAAPAPAVLEPHRIDAIPAVQPLAPAAPVELVDPADGEFLAALLGTDTDLPPALAASLIDRGHRVCSGLDAQVPTESMRDALMVDLGLTDDEARALLAAAVAVYCPTIG